MHIIGVVCMEDSGQLESEVQFKGLCLQTREMTALRQPKLTLMKRSRSLVHLRPQKKPH